MGVLFISGDGNLVQSTNLGIYYLVIGTFKYIVCIIT